MAPVPWCGAGTGPHVPGWQQEPGEPAWSSRSRGAGGEQAQGGAGVTEESREWVGEQSSAEKESAVLGPGRTAGMEAPGGPGEAGQGLGGPGLAAVRGQQQIPAGCLPRPRGGWIKAPWQPQGLLGDAGGRQGGMQGAGGTGSSAPPGC